MCFPCDYGRRLSVDCQDQPAPHAAEAHPEEEI